MKKALDSDVFLSLKVEFKKIFDELEERYNFNGLEDIAEPEGSTKTDEISNDIIESKKTDEVLDFRKFSKDLGIQINIKDGKIGRNSNSCVQGSFYFSSKKSELALESKSFHPILARPDSHFIQFKKTQT